MFKYLWTISTLGRPLSRQYISILSRNGTVRTQHVRVRKPFLTQYLALLRELNGPPTANSLFGGSRNIFLFCATALLYPLGQDIIFEEQYDDEVPKRPTKKLSEQSKIDTSKKSSFFIPLGLARERPTTYYKSSDPEWVSFYQFVRDQEKCIAVRKELAYQISQDLGKRSDIQENMGFPIVPRKLWLDLHIPYSPPPEYEQRGIEFTSEEIMLTTRPMSAQNYSWIQNSLQPIPMLMALGAGFQTFWSLKIQRLYELFTSRSKGGRFNALSSTASPEAGRHQETPLNPSPAVFFPDLKRRFRKENLMKDHPEVSSKQDQFSNSNEVSPWEEDLDAAFTALDKTFSKHWMERAPVYERGTVFLSGLIRIEGPKAICIADVTASYHPGESRWVTREGRIRQMIPKQLVPVGGA